MILTVLFIVFAVGGLADTKYEAFKNLDNYDITLVGEIEIITFTGTKEGDVTVIDTEKGYHSIKIIGWQNGEYSFTICDEMNNEYNFEYHFDKENNTIVLNQIK